MKQRFKLTNKTKKYQGKTLYQIEALTNFWEIKKGDVGGFVESEENLSQQGECWIYPKAMAMDQAQVLGNALLLDKSIIKDNAIIDGYSRLYGNAVVKDNAKILGATIINNQSEIYGNAELNCSEDGPLVPSQTKINFNVHYHAQFIQLNLNYIDKIINISEQGFVCFDDWSGTLAEFEKEVKQYFNEWEEMLFAVEAAKLYVKKMKTSYRHGDRH